MAEASVLAAPGAHVADKSNKAVLAAAIGNLLEWYDFGVYAYLARLIATKFFPNSDPTASLLAAFAAYGVGFLARPLGGIVIGRLGDTKVGEREFLRRLDHAADPQQHPLVSSTIVMHEPNGILIAAQVLPGRNSPLEVDVPSVGRSAGRAGPIRHQCRVREHLLIDCRLLAIRLDYAVEFIFGRQTPSTIVRYAQRHRGIPIHSFNVAVTSAAFARGLAAAASHPCQFCFQVVDGLLFDYESRGGQLRRRARIAYSQRCARRDNKAQANCRGKANSKSWQHCFLRSTNEDSSRASDHTIRLFRNT
jgi:hypothetical protein